MKHHVLGSLTAALVMSSFGAPLASHAQQVDETDPLPSVGAVDIPEVIPNESPSLASNAAVHPEILDSGSNEFLPPEVDDSTLPLQETTTTPQVQTLNLASLARNESFSIVQAHAFDNRQAATLYVHNIPVLTFLGNQLATLADNKSIDNTTPVSTSDPMVKANQIGAQLEQFYQAQGDATQISVRWDAQQESYLVTLNGNPLVAVNSDTILPDTTGEAAEDALNIANRLRRLMGDAPPLEEVEGMPAVGNSQTLAVTSVLTGMASWYGPGFHGRRSASGEMFNQNALTAAHRTLPFGTQIRVTNLSNRQQVIVRVNDRGPYAHGRVLDLSEAAARAIGLTRSGVGMVQIEVLGRP
ncbi:MAG TPA: septal ring lytic transglycosylase RlpA family protein [Leptolyngbyaceae cyanobacterium]